MVRSSASFVLTVLLTASCAASSSPTPGASAETPGPSSSVASGLPSVVSLATPAATLLPVPTSTPQAGGTAWPLTVVTDRGLEPVFGPDGTAYLITGGGDAELLALDRGGHAKPGWPVKERPGADFGSPAAAPDGSVYVEECSGPTVGCVLHRIGDDGRDRSGWPVEVPSDFACSAGGRCQPDALHLAPDGTVYVTHWREAGGLHVLAVDATGKIKPGWPVAPNATGSWWSNVQVGSDGTLYILGEPDGSDNPTSLAAFGPNGSSRAGWPVSVPDRSAYLLGPQGTVVVRSLVDNVGELCDNPRRTVFTVLGPDGRTLPGWPRGSTGYASSPVVGADGTVHYVSATYKVYALGRVGEVRTGWPVAVPGAGNGCGPESPHLAPDGTVYVLGEEVTALSADGRARPGWPYRPSGSLIGPCFDSECIGGHRAPSFGPDGTMYLVVYHGDRGAVRAEVVAVDRLGQVKSGWPYRLPFDANTAGVGEVTVSPDGRLMVRGGESSPYVLLALDADGRLAR